MTTDAASVGMWSPSRSWPLVSIHTALLADGTVLTFGSPVGQGAQDGRTFVRWDPLSNQMTTTPNAQGVNSFCAAAVLQPDTGRLLISGGNEAVQSMGQRYYGASFSQSGNLLTVNAPPGPQLAPPGFHQIFAVDAAGVPSRGFIISLGESACSSEGECDDGNDCTIDECSGGVCAHENVCTDPLAIYRFESGAEDDTGNGRDGALVSGASIAHPHFNGRLDEVQLSCRAFSTQEIAGLADTGRL